jgi:hypothetical protein
MDPKIPLSVKKEKARRDYIWNFFRERELISFYENVIVSEKLFKLNAVLRWCLDKIESKKMSTTQWKKYNKIISQYVAGIVEIEWGDNSFKTVELKKNERRRNRTKS